MPLSIEDDLFQRNPLAAIRAANEELAAVRKSGDRQAEVKVLVSIAHGHAMLGEPLSAIKAAEQAVAVCRALGDKEGEAASLHTIAEMRKANSEYPLAAEAARQALAAFRAAKSAAGEAQALDFLSNLFAEQGKLALAPNRPEAIKVLRELAKSIDKRDKETFLSLQEKFNRLGNLVTEVEIADVLRPALAKDGAMDFWKECGGDGGGEVKGYEGSYIKQFSHGGFYLHTAFTGMGFGPQFRAVHPYRYGRNPKDYLAMEVGQLPETEAWQMDLQFRPGIMDSALQCTSVLGFP